MLAKLHHFSLHVSEIGRSVKWFEDVFDLHSTCVLNKDDEIIVHLIHNNSCIELIQQKNCEPIVGSVHVGFSTANLDNFLENLNNKYPGTIVEILNYPVQKIAFFKDPDGYLIEVNQGMAEYV